MKNVLIYNRLENKLRYDDDILISTLKAQIDNSINHGWDIKDIILGTNFDFNYRGVKNHVLKDICYHNPFYNKFYGMLELMERGILNKDFWFHDQDAWQINPIKFPEFEGEIGGCTYVATPEWNTCSLFIKKTAIHILKYIVDSMKMNSNIKVDSDENWISILRHNSEIKSYLTTINNQYNVGRTFMEKRYTAAKKPACIIAFQPQVPESVSVFNGEDNEFKINLINKNLDKIFKTHIKGYINKTIN